MDNALDLFLKRNNETQKMMNLAFAGNSTMQKFAEMQSNWKEKFNIMDIFDSRKRIDLIINNDWSKSFQNDSLKNIETALYPLKHIHRITENINKQTDAFAFSQFLFKGNIELLTKSYNEKLFKSFNPILPAFTQFTKSFLQDINEKDIDENEEIEELEIVTSVANSINSVSELYFENEVIDYQIYFSQINQTLIDLQNSVSELKPNKTEKWFTYINAVMGLISFLSIFYNPLNAGNEKLVIETNNVVKEILKNQNINEDRQTKSSSNLLILGDFHCTVSSNLFLKPNKNSKIISVIKQGQKIKILEVRRKYCCIAILPESNHPAIMGYMEINNTDYNK